MNNIATFFRNSSYNSSVFSIHIDIIGAEYSEYFLEIYCNSPIEEKFKPEQFRNRQEYQKFINEISSYIAKNNGGFLVEVSIDQKSPYLKVSIFPIDPKYNYNKECCTKSIFQVTTGGMLEAIDFPSEKQNIELKLLKNSHIIIPVNQEAEKKFLSFREGYSTWFPGDFETVIFEALRQPSLGLRTSVSTLGSRVNQLEKEILTEKKRSWLIPIIGYFSISAVIAITAVFLDYHYLRNPVNLTLSQVETKGDGGSGVVPKAEEPSCPNPLDKLLESARKQQGELTKQAEAAKTEKDNAYKKLSDAKLQKDQAEKIQKEAQEKNTKAVTEAKKADEEKKILEKTLEQLRGIPKPNQQKIQEVINKLEAANKKYQSASDTATNIYRDFGSSDSDYRKAYDEFYTANSTLAIYTTKEGGINEAARNATEALAHLESAKAKLDAAEKLAEAATKKDK